MDKELVLNGRWWLPESPEDAVAGTLKYVRGEGTSLELIGAFKKDGSSRMLREYPVVIGSAEGRAITLLRCTGSNFSETPLVPASPPTSEIRAEIMLCGAHFKNADEAQFSSFYIRFPHLNEWFNTNLINIDHSTDDGDAITWKRHEGAVLHESPELKILIWANHHLHASRLDHAKVEQRTYLVVEFTNKISLPDFWKFLFRLQQWLSLGVSRAMTPAEITTSVPPLKEGGHDREVGIFRNYSRREDAPVRAHEMLYTHPDIKSNSSQYLGNWLAKAENLGPVMGLHYGVLSNDALYLENQFLSSVQALEAFHRRTTGVTHDIPRPAHELRLKSILDTAPGDHRVWLGEALAYSNEPRLRRRLNDLIEPFPFLLKYMNVEQKAFVNKIVDTRNYLTHFNEALHDKAARGRELTFFPDKLSALFKCCMLRELGMPVQDIQNLVSRNSNLMMLFQYN